MEMLRRTAASPKKPKVRGIERLKVGNNTVYPCISRQLHQVCFFSGFVKEEPMVLEGAQWMPIKEETVRAQSRVQGARKAM